MALTERSMLLILRQFISQAEKDDLNSFVDKGVREGWLGPGTNRGGYDYDKRYSSRMHTQPFEYPPVAFDVYARVTGHLSFSGLKKSVRGPGKGGIVVSCTFSGGDVYEHIDPKEPDGLDVLRCNIMTRKPLEGGVLFVGGRPIHLEEGDLHCYLASDVKHYVTTVSGPRSRVLWMFGFQIAKKEWLKKIPLIQAAPAQIA